MVAVRRTGPGLDRDEPFPQSRCRAGHVELPIVRAVVAGGAGFIGSHLCDRLLNEGATVTCVDNLITGAHANIAHLVDNPRFSFIQHDVIEPLDAEADAVFHLASPASPNPASPRSYIAHSIETALVNSQGTY